MAAFPLAPFFALANNIFEIRIDSDKFVCEVRRPIADRAQDIGIWFDILDSVAKIAVISNVSTTKQLQRLIGAWSSVMYVYFSVKYFQLRPFSYVFFCKVPLFYR